MRKIRIWFSRIPIKWKLTLWSALLLFLLFAVYNVVQYMFVEKWMKNQAETQTQEDMREVLNYLLEKEFTFEESELTSIRNFLEKVNGKNQLIRVLNENGEPIVYVSDDMSEQWINVYPDSTLASSGSWFLHSNLLLVRSPLTIFTFNGTIEIVKNIEDFEHLSAAFFRIMLICCVGAILISGIGGGLLARQLLKPLQSMNDAMISVKQKGLQERVQLNENKNDEIATLMKLFNEMMDQLERSFEQQKQFVEDASHELRTPIAIVEGHLALLQRWGKDDSTILEESLQASSQELSRLKGLVQELLALSRAEKEPVYGKEICSNAKSTIEQLVKNVELLHPRFHCDVDLSLLTDVDIFVSKQHLEQIMLILMDNAVNYSGASRTIDLCCLLEENNVVIQVEDFGVGISENDLPLVMNRFYRTDRSRSSVSGGHGLGLAIAKRLVDRYEGSLLIESRERQGTTVSVILKKVTRK